MSNSALLVLTTCANADEADEIAGAVVEERLAACVNRVDGVMSTYKWESRLQRDKEILLLIKTTEARFDELQIRDCAAVELRRAGSHRRSGLQGFEDLPALARGIGVMRRPFG